MGDLKEVILFDDEEKVSLKFRLPQKRADLATSDSNYAQSLICIYKDKKSKYRLPGRKFPLTLTDEIRQLSTVVDLEPSQYIAAMDDPVVATEIFTSIIERENSKSTPKQVNSVASTSKQDSGKFRQPIDGFLAQDVDALQDKISEKADQQSSESEEEDPPASAKTKKSKSWSENEEKFLLATYSQHLHVMKSGKHAAFWRDVTKEINEKLRKATESQIKDKMNNLKKRYKNVVDHNAATGEEKKTCHCFDELDELFRAKPYITLEYAAGKKIKLKSRLNASSVNESDDDESDKNIRNPKCSKEKLMQSLVELKKQDYESREKHRNRRSDAIDRIANYYEKKTRTN